ncbi:hypothetical protein, partial [Salmonella enterica]|uniref:hypothetical protein n=1 Tax=Salmonella enterica TaxID=28901 RepID=UPI00329959A2
LTRGRFWPEFRPDELKYAPKPTENGERVRKLLRGREALPAQPEKPYSARAGGPGRGADVRIVLRSDLT